MGFKPEILEGGKGNQGQFVCPWCGMSFEHRYMDASEEPSLASHWVTNPRCKALANVNNPTQSKYKDNED